MLITDNKVLTRCAAKYYNTFKVPTMLIESAKKKRKYTSADKASLDIFCDSDKIGVIVNLSQELNTLLWQRVNKYGDWNGAMDAYYDNCLLSILSMVAIDQSKKEYALDTMEELKIIRDKYDLRDNQGRAIRPYFFAHVAKRKGYYDPEKKFYMRQMAPMDFLQDIVDSRKKIGKQSTKITCTIGDIIKCDCADEQARKGYVDLVLSMVNEMDANIRSIYQIKSEVVVDKVGKHELANLYYKRCIDGIKNLNLNNATVRELIVEMDNPNNSHIRRRLWTIVFESLGQELSRLIKVASEPVYTLEECKNTDDADVYIYNYPFKKKLVS